MPRKRDLYIPLTIFLFSLLLRLALITKGPYHLDCLELALRGRDFLTTHHLPFLFGPGYPLAVLLSAFSQLSLKAFGLTDPVLAVNGMSVVFSSFCVLLFYVLTRQVFEPTTAILSAMILAVTPLFLGVSVYGMTHAPALLFLFLSLVSLLSYFKTRAKRQLILAAVYFGLLGATRAQDMILMSIPLSFLFFFGDRLFQDAKPGLPATESHPPGIKNFLLVMLISGFVALAFHLPFLISGEHSAYHQQLSSFVELGLWKNFQGPFSMALWDSLVTLVAYLSPLGAIATLLGLFLLGRTRRVLAVFLVLWWVVPLSFYGNLYSMTPRLFVIFLPALILPQAFLFSQLIKVNRIFRRIGIILFGITLGLNAGSIAPLLFYRHTHAPLVDFAHWVEQKTEPNSLIIAGDQAPFLEYYSQRKTLCRPASYVHIDPAALQAFQQNLDRLLLDKIPVYITAPALYNYDPQQRFSHLIFSRYQITYLGQFAVEEWYRGELQFGLNYYPLYRVSAAH